MPITVADRKKVWSAKTTVEVRQKSLMYNLLDKSWQQEWQNGASSVEIANVDWEASVVASTRARGGNWANATTLDQDTKSLTRVGGYSASTEIPWDDVLELPWAALSRVRSRQMWAIKNAIDKAVYDAMRTAASQTISAGDDSTFVRRTAPYDYTVAAGKRHPVAEVIELFALAMVDANVVDGDMSPTDSPGMPWVIIQPALALSLSRWLQDQKIRFEPFSLAMFNQNPAALMEPNPLHMYSGCLVLVWNHLPTPSGAGTNWDCYGGVMAAGACGIREPIIQYFPPELNQVSAAPSHLLRQIGDYAVTELDDDFHRKLVVDAGA